MKVNEALNLARNGQKREAFFLLKEVVRAEPDNEKAWFVMYFCVNRVEQKKFCLQEVLRINPANQKAQETYEKLFLSAPAVHKVISSTTKTGPLKPQNQALVSPQPPATSPKPVSNNYDPIPPQLPSEKILASPAEIKALALNLKTKDLALMTVTANRIRELRITSLIHPLMEHVRQLRFGYEVEGLVCREAINQAICDLCSPDEIYNFARKNFDFSGKPNLAAQLASRLAAAGMYKKALEIIMKSHTPSVMPSPGYNLPAILAYADIPVHESICRLCNWVTKEKKYYEPGISGGYFLSFFDPVSFLITAALSVALTVASTSAQKSAWNQAGELSATLMVMPAQVDKKTLDLLPPPLVLMTAYHCYATALAGIARKKPKLVLDAAQDYGRGIQQAVIGMALAENAMEAARPCLQKAVKDDHWAVRVLGYEGLVLFNNKVNCPPDKLTLKGLRDHDMRVVLSAATAMVASGRKEYEEPIMALNQESDAKRRVAYLQPIASLAKRGNQAAYQLIQAIAQHDNSSNVREQAREHMKMIGLYLNART